MTEENLNVPEETPFPQETHYPVFSMGPDGTIVSDDETEGSDGGPSDPSETLPPYSVEVAPGEWLVIPGGNGSPTVIMQQQEASDPLAQYADSIEAIQSDIAYLASVQASNYGYLGTQALDAFDRVAEQNAYRYYCAFRESSDAYNGVMYMSDHVEVSGSTVTFKDSVQVRVYRTYVSNTYYYYYSRGSAGDVQVNFSGNLMYYTNAVEGYPCLGGISVPYKYPSWVMPVILSVLLAAFFAWRSRRS